METRKTRRQYKISTRYELGHVIFRRSAIWERYFWCRCWVTQRDDLSLAVNMSVPETARFVAARVDLIGLASFCFGAQKWSNDGSELRILNWTRFRWTFYRINQITIVDAAATGQALHLRRKDN